MAEQEKSFVGGILDIPKNLAKGIGDIDAAYRYGGRENSPSAQRSRQAKLSEVLQVAKGLDPKDVEGQAFIKQKLKEIPGFEEFKGKINFAKQSQFYKDTSLDRIKSIGTVYNAAKAIGDEPLMNSAAAEQRKAIGDSGMIPASNSDPDPAPTTQQLDTAKAIYNTTFDALKKTQGYITAGRVSDEAAKASMGKYFVETHEKGIPLSVAESTYSKLSKEQMDKKGILTDKVYPKGFTASLFFPRAQGPPKPEDTQESTSEKPAGKLPNEKPVKAFEDYAQVATENFPVDNTPKSYAALGITEPADQQSMQEFMKPAKKAGIDLNEVAKFDPDFLKNLFALQRKGRTPDGRPFGIKEMLKIITDAQNE